MARYIAKNIVAAGLASKCEVQLGYVIGVAEPVSISVTTFGTGRVPDENFEKIIRAHFPVRPRDMINHLNLLNPIYKKTACYGHFGRSGFSWENTDKVAVLKKYL